MDFSTEPKYKINTLIRNKYGELKFRQGVTDFVNACGITRKSFKNWTSIPAGGKRVIDSHCLPSVLGFLGLKSESQLHSTAHKQLLKQKTSDGTQNKAN